MYVKVQFAPSRILVHVQISQFFELSQSFSLTPILNSTLSPSSTLRPFSWFLSNSNGHWLKGNEIVWLIFRMPHQLDEKFTLWLLPPTVWNRCCSNCTCLCCTVCICPTHSTLCSIRYKTFLSISKRTPLYFPNLWLSSLTTSRITGCPWRPFILPNTIS